VLMNLRPGDEYYIVVGGSTDGSLDIIRKYEGRISGWLSEPDRGYADALHKGFARTSAPLMCWINSVDLLLRGSLDLRRESFAHTDADMLFGDDYYIDEQGFVIQQTNGEVGYLDRMMLFGGWTPLQDACSWRRALYDELGGIDATLQYAADYDLFLRMSLHGESRYMSAVLSAFRRHASQKSVADVGSYEVEREMCRKRQLVSASPVSRFVYLWLTRLRSRISSRNKRHSLAVGKRVSDCYAGYGNVSE